MTGLTHPAAADRGPQLDNRRVLAAVVDVLLVAPVALLMATLTDGFNGTSAALTVAWALFYYFAFESSGGQTVGKRLLRLRVVRSDGSEPGLREVAVRTVLRIVDGLFAYLVGLAVMLATGERRQRLGDLAAGTVVASADAGQASPTVTPVVEAPPSHLDFEPVEEASEVDEDEDGVPVVEPLDADVEDEQDLVDEIPAEVAVVEDDEAPAEDEEAPVEDDEARVEDEGPVAVEVAEPVASLEVAEPEPDEDEPAPADEEQPSVGSGVEIVSAIDLIMADARESAERERAGEDAGDPPAEDAGDEPASS